MENEPPRDPDSLPDSSDPSGPCPRCGRVSNFTVVNTVPVTFRKDGTYWTGPGGVPERPHDAHAAVLECNGCRDRIVVIEEELVGGVRGGRAGARTYRGFHWWPTPGGRRSEQKFRRQSPRPMTRECGALVRTRRTALPRCSETLSPRSSKTKAATVPRASPTSKTRSSRWR